MTWTLDTVSRDGCTITIEECEIDLECDDCGDFLDTITCEIA